jgi:hypothetical protein
MSIRIVRRRPILLLLVHYWIPVSVIANAGVWTFLVKTRTGWRFWGDWCGAGKPRRWRNYYCY